MKYDAIFNRTCQRNLTTAAAQPLSLAPLFLNGKPINQNQYWPNNGNSYPAHFYTDTPPFVFHLHVHTNAVVNGIGDVFSGHSALALYLCRDASTKPQTALPTDSTSSPPYEEVVTLAQMWGTATFHRMVEVVPRIAFIVDFLKEHPKIKLHVAGSQDGRLKELLNLFGIGNHELIEGTVRAKIVYQPRPTGCGFANVQECRLSSKYYRTEHHRSTNSRPNRSHPSVTWAIFYRTL